MKGIIPELEKITYRHSSRSKKGRDTDSRVNRLAIKKNRDTFGLLFIYQKMID